MTEIVKVSIVPGVLNPIEGTDYTVLDGQPQQGDPVRIDGRIFTYYSVAVQPPPVEYKTLTPSQFFGVVLTALGATRTKDLLGDELVRTALGIAKSVDRHSGNTPVLIAYLGANGLTANELTAIETAWKAV